MIVRKDIDQLTVSPLIKQTGSGIGRLLAHKFSDLGATLVLWDVNETGNQETANQVRENGGTVHDYTVDISVSDNVYNAAEIVKRDVGDVSRLP